jgi:Bacterial protein of unknown function (DUF899)
MSSEDPRQLRGDIDTAALPPLADRATFQAQLDQLRVREKAHTRAGDAIAAARRRLPMVEVDGASPLIGAIAQSPRIEAGFSDDLRTADA